MPNYDYHCLSCEHKLEVFQKMTEDPIKMCPQCKKETLRRGPGGGIGLSFAGSGWYKTDYATSKSGGCCPCGKNKEGGCS